MTQPTLDTIISEFGHSVSRKLSSPAITGAREDQLRGPLETLIRDGMAGLLGYREDAIAMIGETSLTDSLTRPD